MRLLLLAAIVMALLRGLYWVAITPVWGPIDEAHHFAYVETVLATGRPPIIGRDLVSAPVLDLMKSSPTGRLTTVPTAASPTDPRWGVSRQQYEGHQPPLYYYLVAPVLGVARGFGLIPAIYAVRVATLLIALAAVPLTFALGRLLFPDRPRVAAFGCLTLALAQGFNANLAAVTNDALVVTAGAALLVAAARSWRRGWTLHSALATGVLAGIAALTKGSTVTAAAVVVLAWAVALPCSRPAVRRAMLLWAVVVAATASVFIAPWALWTIGNYDVSPARIVFDMLTVHVQPPLPFGGDALHFHATRAIAGFWDSHLFAQPVVTLYRLWLFLPTFLGPLWLCVAEARRRHAENAVLLLLLALAFPAAYATHLAVVYTGAFGGAVTLGRMLYACLAACAIAVGATLAWSPNISAGLATAVWVGLSYMEHGLIPALVVQTYTVGVLDGSRVPVVEQIRNDEWRTATPISVRTSCKADRVGVLHRTGEPPPRAQVSTSDGRRATIAVTKTFPRAQAALSVFALPRRMDRFELDVGNATIGSTRRDEHAELDWSAGGDPAVLVYCPVRDARNVRFEQRFFPNHLDVPRAAVEGAPRLWTALLAAGALAVGGRAHLRRRDVL